jgi:hypothetical protein
MNFGEALQALKEGKKVKREIWGGYWELINEAKVHDCELPLPVTFGMSNFIIAILKNSGGIVPAQPYQQDLLAEDWQIID